MKLFYRELGEGDPLIILHGLYGSSDNWMSIGRELSSSFKVFLVDQRNHGRSPHSTSHTYADLANDLHELLGDLGITKARLIGHSMGGKTAMLFAALYPEKVESLIIVDILPFSSASNDNFNQLLVHRNILSSLLMLHPESVSSREELDKALSKSISDFAVRQFLLKSLKRNDQGTFSWIINVQSLSDSIIDLMGPVLPIDKFTKIEVPTLFVKGERSNYMYNSGVSSLKDYFSNYDLVEVPNAGHWLHSENQEAFLNYLRSFLRV